MNILTRPLVAAFATLALATFAAAPAWACGGFFCFTQPVDQSAERILYLQDHGKMTVHIQISYTGDDDKFSWILPLQKQPTLGIGSDTVFQILEQWTAPSFQLEWQQKANCFGGGMCLEDAQAGGPPNSGTTGSGGVKVLAEQAIGPYDTVVLQGDTGKAVVDWLNKNGYVQPKSTEPLVEHYTKQKYVFLALKLQKDKGSGDLTPIVVTLAEVAPCLPLRLTQLAATPDMPIVAWVLGDHRAIPKNFLHVELNDATIDWLAPGTNYKTVVSKAVDQGSGHAFTTEYAQLAATLLKDGAQFSDPKWKTADLEGIDDPGNFMMALLEKNYPRTSQMQTLVRKFIPKPDAFAKVTDQEFYNCISCNGCETSSPCKEYKAAVNAQPFDGKNFAQAIQTGIVEPLTLVQSAFAKLKYVTRLYTTVSPEEMDKDPIFAFNPDLPTVDRVHKAKAEPMCDPAKKQGDPGFGQATEVKLTFADGHMLTVPVKKDAGPCWGLGGGVAEFGKGKAPLVDAGGQPAKKVQVMDEKGPPLDVHPLDADKVDAALNGAVAGKPSLDEAFRKTLLAATTWDYKKPGTVTTPPTGGTDAAGGGADAGAKTGGGAAAPASKGGCTAKGTGHGAGGLALLLAGLAGLVALRRRVKACTQS